MSFEQYFETDYLKEYFYKHLIHKDGGGWDGMDCRRYADCGQLAKDLPKINRKCTDGKYRFTRYAEKLILKGHDKLPRVISIPSVRDRLTIGALHQYLTNEIGLRYPLNPPARYINEIRHVCESEPDELYFTKIDFTDFYGHISHPTLISTLSDIIRDNNACELICGAIQTPTVSREKTNDEISSGITVRHGVPQGLAISNFLAAKYMEAFDEDMHRRYGSKYIRYVDDILVLTSSSQDAADVLNVINDLNKRLSLDLVVNKDKTCTGCLDSQPSGIDFLGYRITRHGIGVRESTMLNFERNLTTQCLRLRKEYLDDSRRPGCLRRGSTGDDSAFAEHVRLEMRMTVSGIKIGQRAFGWLPYFRCITDVAQLYRLDRMIRKFFHDTDLVIDSSFVRSYYSYKSGDPGCMVDIDAISDVCGKRTFLLRKGVINNERVYSDDQIESLFARVVGNIIKKQKKDIKYYS